MKIFGIHNHNNTPNFEAKKIRKLSSFERLQYSSLTAGYNKIIENSQNLNNIQRRKFDILFPNLTSKKDLKGFFLEIGENAKQKLHIFKEGKWAPLTICLLNNNDEHDVKCSANLTSMDMTINTSKNYDESGQNVEHDIKNLLYGITASMAVLSEYAQYFTEIEPDLQLDASIDDIINLLDNVKNKTAKDKEPEPVKYPDKCENILTSYAALKEVLYQRGGQFTWFFRQHYPANKATGAEKGVSFIDKNGDKVNFLPQTSKNDDRVFRIYKYNQDNNLKLALFGFKNGSFSKLKDEFITKAPIGLRLEKLNTANGDEYDIGETLDFLIDEINKFKQFIDETSTNNHLLLRGHKFRNFDEIAVDLDKRNILGHKRIEKKDTVKIENNVVTVKTSKKIQETSSKLKQEPPIAKAEAITTTQTTTVPKTVTTINADKSKVENKPKSMTTVTAPTPEVETVIEKDPLIKEKVTKNESLRSQTFFKLKSSEQKTLPAKPTNNEVFCKQNISSIHDIIFKNLIKYIETTFATPVEQRPKHLSHETLSNGKIFPGKFFTITDDGTKVSVIRMKSSRYDDFLYYSIRAEKDGNAIYLNIDPTNESIILSNRNGKPMIYCDQVQYISKTTYTSNHPEDDAIAPYIQELIEGSDKIGEILDTKLKAKSKTNKKVLDIELPPDIEDIGEKLCEEINVEL